MTDSTRTDAPRPGTTHPHLARERALKVLFAADVRGVDPRTLLDVVETHPADLELLDELEPDEDQVAADEDLQLELTRRRRLPLDDYTRLLVEGVASHRPAIDELLGAVADRWAVRRMPAVDRNLLRLAVYELSEQDTPHAVVIDEAVSLAIAFAGEKARGFVNGVLETIRQQVVAGEVDLSVPTVEESVVGDPADDEDATDGEAAAVAADEAETVADGAREDEVAVTAGADTVEGVDHAAQEAYDLALDLLDAEGPLEQWVEDDPEDPEEADAGDDGADARFELLSLEELEGADLEDEDDALW